MKDFAKRRRFIELRAEGKSYGEICKELSISKGTCSAWSREMESEINQFRADQLRELYDQYYIMRSGRIAALAGKVKKLESEMDRRPLSEISTENLWRLYRQFYEMLRAEIIDVQAERWEKSLAAMFMDLGLEDELLVAMEILFDEDRQEAMNCMSTITEIGELHDGNGGLPEGSRFRYQDAVCRLNTIYRRYGLQNRVPIIFELMPLQHQTLLKEIVKAADDLQRKFENRSSLFHLTDSFREDILRMVRSRNGLFRQYGMTDENFKFITDETLDQWIENESTDTE